MSAGEEKPRGLVPSQVAALSQSGAKALAARGRADLRSKEQAEEWLRKGLELQNKVWNDPKWWPLGDPQWDAQKKYYDRILLAREYFNRIQSGENPDSAAAALQMTHEEQELANALHLFLPTSFPILVDKAQRAIEEHRTEIAKLEEMAREAFSCFQNGLDIDPCNLDLIGNMADCYGAGFGVHEDEEIELALLEKAAHLGDPGAQTALGYHYWDGLRGGPNNELAAYWFSRAAEQGDEIAISAIKKIQSAS